MENFWRDITLSSLKDQDDNSSNKRLATASQPLQDFIALPSDKESHCRAHSADPALFCTPPLGTMLSLSFGSEFSCPENSEDHVKPNPSMQGSVESNTHTYNDTFDLACSSVFPCKKRGSEDDGGSGDRRHKRMMKNRESAARSRARRQAYTTELELKLCHLREENASLRREQKKFYSGGRSELSKKRALFRALSAPF